jgi:hypothetical protein
MRSALMIIEKNEKKCFTELMIPPGAIAPIKPFLSVPDQRADISFVSGSGNCFVPGSGIAHYPDQ